MQLAGAEKMELTHKKGSTMEMVKERTLKPYQKHL